VEQKEENEVGKKESIAEEQVKARSEGEVRGAPLRERKSAAFRRASGIGYSSLCGETHRLHYGAQPVNALWRNSRCLW
jgi:hypothetical protein